jgi:transcriptional regulator with XRE-family HTH domain
MKKWPNIGDRIRERLLRLGYERNGKPDVMRFALEKGVLPVYLYRWIGGATPDYDNIIRLARDLETSPGWLMFGDAATAIPAGPRSSRSRQTPIRGGSGAAAAVPAPEPDATPMVPPAPRTLPARGARPRRGHNQDAILLIRSWPSTRSGHPDAWPQAA